MQLQLDNLGIDYFQRRTAMIDAVTLDDAKRVAKRLLDNGMLVTVVGRPEGVASAAAADRPAGLRSPGQPAGRLAIGHGEFRITLSGN